MVLNTWLCDFCGTPKDSAFSRQAAERVQASTRAPRGAGGAQMGGRPTSPCPLGSPSITQGCTCSSDLPRTPESATRLLCQTTERKFLGKTSTISEVIRLIRTVIICMLSTLAEHWN